MKKPNSSLIRMVLCYCRCHLFNMTAIGSNLAIYDSMDSWTEENPILFS